MTFNAKQDMQNTNLPKARKLETTQAHYSII